MSLSPGVHLSSRYEILAALGAGGMGEVYRARDSRLGREVAIKVLPDHLAQNPQALSRFEREAKALAALSHPNILAIFDFGSHEGISFAVMELLKGETLRSHLAHSKLTWKRAIEVGIPIADGLAAAHSAGVIHRDLKPENIFITSDGRVRILDFGLVRWQESVSEQDQTTAPTISRTSPGIVMGTLGYMSPEQVRGESVDVRSDIFSFGCVLYEMISGHAAFKRNTAAESIAAILKEDPQEILTPDNSVPAPLQEMIFRCLNKNPDQRFQTARDLAFALQTISSGSIKPASSSIPLPLHTAVQLRMGAWLVATLIALIGAASIYLFVSHQKSTVQSLAILPFINSTQDPNTEYLSDGITESIIGTLSQLPKLKVMAHSTVFTYKGKTVDARKVGRDLKVDRIVTGRIMQQGDNLIIRADLVNVEDGTEVWGQQYSQKLTDILQMQQDISKKIAENLQLKLTGEQQKLLNKRYTENTEAYQLYLKGRYYWYKFTFDDLQKSVEFYEKAITEDPKYALAYAGLADTYHSMTTEGMLSPKEGFEKVESAAMKALEIDDTLAQTHAALAAVRFAYNWDWKAAEREAQRAIELDPNCVECHNFYNRFLRAMGRFDEAIVHAKRAQELDPLSSSINQGLGATFYWAGKYDRAIDQYKKILELDPNFAEAHNYLADVYARKGMHKDAINEEQKYLQLVGESEAAELLKQDYESHGYSEAKRLQYQRTLDLLKKIAKEEYVSPMGFVFTYAFLNDKDQAFAWLEKAFQERSIWLVNLKTDPQYDLLRSDPRFKKLLQRIGLP